jgi:D-lactate dehydrogenase
MKVAVFSAKAYDQEFFKAANQDFAHELVFFEAHLDESTAQLAAGFPAVCIFTNDTLNREVLETLARNRTQLVALRCAGYNNVDLEVAHNLGISVVRVPAYSPYAVAEHAVGMMLTLNRKFHKAYNRMREGNFKLDCLLGFDMYGKTVGVIGAGRIGIVVARILEGFGCRVLAYDPNPSQKGIQYAELSELLAHSDIVTLHCPLMPETHHLIDDNTLARMKTGVMLINTSRGGIVDTAAVIRGLKSGKIGYLGLDVYEEEAELFFEDLSEQCMQDDRFARLMTFPNVLITGHQAFFTREAMENIAHTTLANIHEVEQGLPYQNRISLEMAITGSKYSTHHHLPRC